MLGKYLVFIHLNILQLAEIIMINNCCRGRRLRGQITCSDIKTILRSSFTVEKSTIGHAAAAAARAQMISFSALDFSKSGGTNAISLSQLVYVFMYW